MSKITLPAIISAPKFRKDKSVSISFSSRELRPDEMLQILTLAETEGWLLFSQNEIQESEIPQANAELETKSQAERTRAVLYKLYLQETKKQNFVGSWESFYKDKTEKVIEKYKSLLDESL